MNRIAFAAVVVGTLIGGHPAHAAILTGNQLYEICTNTSEVQQAACLSYIDGVVDSFTDFRNAMKSPECLPQGVTGYQLRDVVVQWLAQHPQYRADTAASLVHGALFDAWPACAH
jgi:Ssp1 endopeptidase immunity protein Rap1a